MPQETIKFGAGVTIIKDGKVLLTKRKGSHGAGMWGTVGGHVKFGESPREAVKREAAEELGIEIGNIKFAICMSLIIEGKQYIDISFTADLVSGVPTIKEPHKIELVEWRALDNLPEPLFDPVRVTLESIKNGEKYFEAKHL